jgi:uncharacterized membrane protein YhhN
MSPINAILGTARPYKLGAVARRVAQILTLACLAAVAGLLLAERFGRPVAHGVLKLGASAAFVLVALSLDATATAYGRWILAALAMGWLGDAALLSRGRGAFLAGLGVFLIAHLCFALAFFTGAHSLEVFVTALAPALAAGIAVWRWLWPHLGRGYGAPVAAYLAAILVMCAAAAGYGAATGRWQVPLGAVLFAVSDVAVARDRFVARGFRNKAWGLPAYYCAQLVLAWSVASAAAMQT